MFLLRGKGTDSREENTVTALKSTLECLLEPKGEHDETGVRDEAEKETQSGLGQNITQSDVQRKERASEEARGVCHRISTHSGRASERVVLTIRRGVSLEEL